LSVPQTIVAFVADLMFQTRLESTAGHLGYSVDWIESAQYFDSFPADQRLALGVEGLLVDQLSRLEPDLLVFDLGNAAIPWEQWIPVLKTIPATRRVPILCFGSHVDVDTLQAARKAGADQVVARSRFVTALPELIQKYARQTSAEVWSDTCAQPLAPKAIKGLELFNQGDYFGAHEWLEEAWKEDFSPGRDLYRGVLQVAVAYFQVRRRNYRGAMKMFQRARYWLDPLPGECRGIDLASLRVQAYAVHDQVLALGPQGIDTIDPALLMPIHWVISN
jgi:predicted metal-dependent hydrolase/CheY-like chemotaxis protein